ncbi:MAG: hypothetical protein CL762_00490 [Chloroflexi bacterium]|nr:hypothetical protein [Chloroflexota bacterium]|tara:strand:+ start:9335 stop:10057 length:723 start_codon:yes stop_codon:yes gene_type:complete
MNDNEKKRVASSRPPDRRGVPKSQIRADRRKRAEKRKKVRDTIVVSSISIFAILVIASLVLPGLLGTRTSAKTREPLPFNAGGPTRAMEDLGNQKILVGSAHIPYQTKPATSGPHWAVRPDVEDLAPFGAPVKWGKYDKEIPDEALLHNLEHGGIGFHYDCESSCEELIEKLDNLRKKDDTQIVLSPYSGLDSKIAITSWRHVLYLDEFNEESINEFIQAYRDRAPQSWIGNYWGDAIQQ